MQTSNTQFSQLALAVLETESRAISHLKDRVGTEFVTACRTILQTPGRLVVSGLGKSGHIGRKIAATFASTGTAAFFVHAAEAAHGDLGMICAGDTVLLLSNSGETPEMITLLSPLKRLGVKIIVLCGNPDSTLAMNADCCLYTGVDQEACPLGLAPTASMIAMLAMGDALAIALLDARGFSESDFARSHPGGQLGKRLLVLVRDIMHTGEEIPRVSHDASLKNALLEITSKGLGMCVITAENGLVLGVFTDGDLRRTLDRNLDIQTTQIDQVMTKNCQLGSADQLAAECLEMMQRLRINALPITGPDKKLIGVINMHDLLAAGVV